MIQNDPALAVKRRWGLPTGASDHVCRERRPNAAFPAAQFTVATVEAARDND
jgi:hypothetical protein